MNIKSAAVMACMSALAFAEPARAAEAFPQLVVPPLPQTYDLAVDWQGFYALALGQGFIESDATAGIGMALGHSWAADELVVSGEVGLARFGDNSVDVSAMARAGWLFSETLMVFALADLGANSNGGAFAGLGAGAELAFTANISARGQYEYRTDLSSRDAAHLGGLGLAYRF